MKQVAPWEKIGTDRATRSSRCLSLSLFSLSVCAQVGVRACSCSCYAQVRGKAPCGGAEGWVHQEKNKLTIVANIVQAHDRLLDRDGGHREGLFLHDRHVHNHVGLVVLVVEGIVLRLRTQHKEERKIESSNRLLYVGLSWGGNKKRAHGSSSNVGVQNVLVRESESPLMLHQKAKPMSKGKPVPRNC